MAATDIKTFTFISRGRNEKLVRQPKVVTLTAIGTQNTVQDSVKYEFAPDGVLHVREGQDMLPDGPLDPNTLQPTVQDAVSWLRNHRLLNDRFHEDGNEPDRPHPTEDVFLERMTAAVAELDADTVIDLLQAERETHQRTMLIRAAERALEGIAKASAEAEKNRAEMIAQAEAAAQPAKTTPQKKG